ncbi:hypothetical protein MCNS_06870 [Mycobacterium conspicuum]|uniref:Uncharacterized protein n=1 Tax=Mycobacterium conspicuum TaxID=44010 RepID=A0A7I7Y8K7_9MYCO|nr:hypothetical protein MCNS_06870 [Mycobacterium conspicuum]
MWSLRKESRRDHTVTPRAQHFHPAMCPCTIDGMEVHEDTSVALTAALLPLPRRLATTSPQPA